jgi:Tfp pilus assembly protein PilF
VSRQQPRARPATQDLDLTPPEEIRARRIRLFVFLGAIGICVLGVAIYFAAPPVAGAIKGWQSRRLARQAFALIDQRKWAEANAKARDAHLLRPSEPESWRAIARLASRTGQSTSALEWWKKVDAAHRLTVEDRRDFMGAALTSGEIALAAKQVEALLAQPTGPAPIDLVFAGQVAARQSDPMLAVDYAERALADKRAKPYDILSAATLILSVTSPYSQRYASAWLQIEAVARDPNNPASLDALVFLANEQALRPIPPIGGNASLSLAGPERRSLGEDGTSTPQPTPAMQGAAASSPPPTMQSTDTVTLDLTATPPPAPGGATMSLPEVANRLENHPRSRPYYKLLALEVRARHDPTLASQYVADAVERFRDGDDETLAALAAWLNKVGRPDKTLEVLPLDRAAQRQDLYLRHLDALAALERWPDVKELLSRERFPIEPVLQHTYLAVAQTHLRSATAATNEWQRALESANTAEKLLALAQYAEQNSADDIADAAYSEAIKIAPKNRAPYTGRLRLALAAGQTAQAQTIAAEIAQLWADDVAARNQDAYLRLLLGASDGAAEAAAREANVLVAKEPRNWLARATLGLACLRLGRIKDALTAIREPRVTGVEPPGPLAVRAAILAANGYEEGARNDARILGAKPLLPEERALIAPLLQ